MMDIFKKLKGEIDKSRKEKECAIWREEKAVKQPSAPDGENSLATGVSEEAGGGTAQTHSTQAKGTA